MKAGKILAVADDVTPYIGPATRKIDARGAVIIPGFIDSHGHMAALGESLEILDLRATKSEQEIADLVRHAARNRKPGEWIRGRAWDQNNWPGRQFPSAAAISAAAPHNPVYLTRVDGHAGWVNRKALELAELTAATPDPPGGKLLRDASGQLTGVLIDRAQELVTRKIPPPTSQQVRERLKRAALECARLGITTVHDAGVGSEELDQYRALIQDHQLPVRVYAMIAGEGDLWREYLRRGPELGDRLTVRSIKLYADGALGSRGAALTEPYSDDPGNTGLMMLQKKDIERVARAAVAHGFQVNTHAIGDLANRTVLDGYAAALGGKNTKRFRIEHAQVVSLEDIPLFEKYSIIASMQATHATSDMPWAESRLGPERVQGAYAWRRFLSLGVHVADGSDFPVENPNPLWGFYAAITRQDRDGNPAGGWFPDQRMTREEALKSWTIEGAYAAFEEETKGSLEPGKAADFVMLSGDIMQIPPAQILKTRVTMTVAGGEVVYSE
ncbi:MAG: amidohydrolase [Acidobacteriia bacterium]|nr:amidohydrolase [Terriglobia bacterium]